MSNSETLSTVNHESIVAEIEIAAPPERIFQALIQPEQLMQWWTSEEMKAEVKQMDARVGGRWHSRQRSSTIFINGTHLFEVSGEILEIDPPRRLTYTWQSSWDPQPSTQSVVCWELSPAGRGTKIKMTHSGLSPETARRYTSGWPNVVGLLKQFVEG